MESYSRTKFSGKRRKPLKKYSIADIFENLYLELINLKKIQLADIRGKKDYPKNPDETVPF
jgi:hypothetical protein